MNMKFIRKLPIPQEVKKMYPLDEELAKIKEKNDIEIKKVFTGESNKLILIIGPCSADNEESVLEYMHRLRALQDKVYDRILIIPRVYTNKPRTTGDGYKGMLHQPNPNEEPDMLKGIIAIRRLHMRVLKETGFSTADELLYTQNHRYINDLLSYVAVGARSVENQEHRLTASGLDIPVGMKNPTSGNLNVMLNSIYAAQNSHMFIYRGWEVISTGNPYAHAILRGYIDNNDNSVSNYHLENLLELQKLYQNDKYQYPSVIIDCNHSNSNKNYIDQINIAKEIISITNENETLKKMVKGLMIESYLVDGCQNVDGGTFGQSSTDPCLGWEKTLKLVLELAELRK
ncbi:MAG: 3-deoxy-7-phosphoheptulonate synthase [Acholeplasmatales bacterium]|nr:3-deoxy-7-phosphoheptulonate synthase [Acholeplasmatales bacterium]